MSLEQALADQTAAIRENTRALAALTEAWNALRENAAKLQKHPKLDELGAAGVPMAEAPQAKAPALEATKPEAPKAEVKAEEAPAATQPAPEAAPEAPAQPEAAAESPSEVTLPVLQALVLEKAKANKAAVLAVLTKYGAKSASTVAEADRAAVYAEVKAL